MPPPEHLDRAAVAREAGRAAATYDSVTDPAREIGDELLSRVAFFDLAPRAVLDLGAGTGRASRALRARFRAAQVIALDVSPAMLAVAGRRARWPRRFDRVAGDACALPLRSGSIDLVHSGLALPWFADLDLALAEIRRVMTPRGLFLFSALGPDTLRELRESWASVDSAVHVHDFVDMHDLGSALARAGFAEPVLDVEHYTRHFESLHALACALRAAGARNAHAARPRGLTTRRRFAALAQAYESRRDGGRLPATFEVVYGAAFAGEPRAARAGGEFVVSLDKLLTR